MGINIVSGSEIIFVLVFLRVLMFTGVMNFDNVVTSG